MYKSMGGSFFFLRCRIDKDQYKEKSVSASHLKTNHSKILLTVGVNEIGRSSLVVTWAFIFFLIIIIIDVYFSKYGFSEIITEIS